MDGYYKKGIKRLGLMTLLGVLLGLRQLKKAGKKIAVRVSPAIKKSVAKADRFVDEKSREVAKKTKEEFVEKNNEAKENGKQNQTGNTKVTAEEFFGRKKTFSKNFQFPNFPAYRQAGNDKSNSNDLMSNTDEIAMVAPLPRNDNPGGSQGPTLTGEGTTTNGIAAVASLPRNDSLASGARNFKFSILKPLKSHISCLSSCLEPYVFFILVFIFKRSRQVWKWFEKTEWGVWAIEKLAPWAKFFWLLVKFLGRKFVLLNTAQKVVATMVIFALLWQSGLSAFAQEGDPLEQIITPEMKVLKDVNPELLKADNFEIEKQIEEIQKEKEGEVNYTLGGLIPKTEEDKVVKEEVKILNEIKDGLHGGLLTSSKPVEYTTINFTQSRNPRVKQAALNIRDILKAKGLFRSIYDEETGEEKEISTQIDSGGGKLKPASVPFGAEFSDKFGDGMMISDFGEGGTTVNENFQVPISSDEPISNDQIPNDGTASATSQGPNLTNPVSGTYEATTEKTEPLTETREATASGNFQLPISNDKSNSKDLMSNTDEIAAVASLPRNDSLATSQNPALTSEASENIAKGMDFASKIYKVLIQDGEKLLVDKTPQFQESISFKPLKTNQAHAVYADNKILYKDAWTGVDVLHSVKAEGVKEDIIIKDKSASNKLYFEVKTKGLQMRVKDGGLQFYDIFGNLKFETPRPFMVDRFGNSKDLNYKVIQDKNFIKQVSVEAEPTENADGATKTEPLTETGEATASGNFQFPNFPAYRQAGNDKSSSNDGTTTEKVGPSPTDQGPTLDETASGTNKSTSFLQKTLNGAKSLALGVKNIFSQIPQLLAEAFWPSKALAGETREATVSGNFQLPISNDKSSPNDSMSNTDGTTTNQGPTLDDVTSPTYDKFFTDRELTPRQKKFNEIIKNSSPKNGRENKLSVFDDSVQKAAEALSQSPNWVLSIFSDEQIKLIAGTLEQVLNETGVKGRALNADQGPSLTMSNYSDEMLKDINEERTYVVAIEMDFTGMSYPIDLDPTTYVNLQDRGQATFHADYSEGSTSGDQGFMNGYGSMTRSSEPFLPKGSQRGYIPMDGVWTDYSGNGYNLTASGGATFAEGKFSQGGTFDGTDDYAYSTNAGYNVPGLLTISAWFKTTATISGNGSTIANLGNAAAGQWRRVYLSTNNQVCMSAYNVSVVCKTTVANINDGTWHHVVAVFGGTASTSHTIYVDNSSQSGTATLNSFGAFQGFFVGTNTDGTDDFSGRVDEAAVWARNLSATEIAGIYNNGRVENTDSRIIYVDPDGTRIAGKVGTDSTALQTNSNWFYGTSASLSNGSQVYYSGGSLGDVSRPGNEKAYIEYIFNGTEIWGGFAKNSVQRLVKAIIDEGTSNEVINYLDTYNPNTLYQQKILIATGLTNGTHTVRIYPQISKNITSNPAAANNPPNFDYFEYYTTGYELAKKSAITINSRATSGLDFINTKPSPAVSYDARGNIPANASGTQERGTWSSWIKTDFAWNADNAPHYVWSNENTRLYYLYDGSTNGNWYFEMYNGTNWTTVQVKSANYTSGNTFASGDVFHLATSWDAAVGTNLYVNNVKTSYVGTWTAQSLTGNMKVGGDEKTKLLLHGDGPDGDARDIDASGNGNPLTFSGDAKISTTQSKFGGSSDYFDGTGDYISAPDSEDFNFGTSNFTVDFWAYSTANTSSQSILSKSYYVLGENGNFTIFVDPLNDSISLYSYDGQSNQEGGTITTAIDINTWYHIAFVREGNSIKVYKNGTLAGTLTVTKSLGNNTGSLLIGEDNRNNDFVGYIDELRVEKGRAEWTANFTAPTGPYHSNMIIAEPTILNYVLTDAEVDAVYASPVSMGEMINGTPGSAAIDSQKKLFSAAKRSEEINQTSKSLLFNYSGVQTADARVGAGAGSLYKTTAPTNPSTTVAKNALTYYGNWKECSGNNCRYTDDSNAYATYTTAGSATEIWAGYLTNSNYGIAEYIIDEGTSKEVRTKVDQYAASATDRYALLATGLENTTHTIKVRWAGTRNLSSTGNYILVGINGTADRMFYYGTTPDIATQDMVVNGKQVKNVLVQDYATMPNAINFAPKGNISQSAQEGTLSLWTQTSWAGNDGVYHALFDTTDLSTYNGIQIFKYTDNTLFLRIKDGAAGYMDAVSPALTTTSWAANVPHHLVLKWWRPTSTTVGLAIYLDGKKVAENKSQTLTPTASFNMSIGNFLYTTYRNETYDFDGAIYDFSIWSWAFDDGNTTLNSYAQPQSDVWKSWKGEALLTDEDLSSQIDGAATTLKLARGGIQQTYARDEYTKLLLHANGANAATTSFDSSLTGKSITQTNATISTTKSEFGGSSYNFNGSNAYISTPASSDFNFGTGDFTIDMWYNADIPDTDYQYLTAQGDFATDYYWGLRIQPNTTSQHFLTLQWSNGAGTSNYVVSNNINHAAGNTGWTHAAIVRSGNDFTFYINGQAYGTTSKTTNNTFPDISDILIIGGGKSSGALYSNYYLSGYLDEYRLSKGLARWTSAFTAPTSEYSAYTQNTLVNSVSVKSEGASATVSSAKAGTFALLNDGTGISATDTSIVIDNEASESEINTSGGYLRFGWSGSNRQGEIMEYSAYDTGTNTFTVSSRGVFGTNATSWPDNTPIEVGGTITLSAAPASGAKVLATYNYQGDELDRDRGDAKSRLGKNNFLDYTASAASGWVLSGDTANKSGRQTITTQVAGQNSFGYFYGAELGYIFSGDTTNGGVAMIIVDEGTGNERRIRSDQNNSATNQFYDQLFSGLSPGYHTFRIISGVDETNSGSNKYGTFDSFVSGTKSDLSLPTTGLSGSESTSGDTVNDTFYYPAWKDQDDVKNTRDANTKLLLHADGANNAVVSYDSALPQKYLTHSGDAKISTTQSKFGGSSISFNGTNSYLSSPDNADWDFSGDFTVDFWANFNSVPAYAQLIGVGDASNNSGSWVVDYYSGNLRFFDFVPTTTSITYAWTPTTGQWNHIAIVRNGSGANNVKLYLNGNQVGQTTDTNNMTAARELRIGANYTGGSGGGYLNGYLDEIRVTKGSARWTGAFTSPDKPYGGFALTADISASVTSLVLDSENPSDLNKLGPNGVVKIGSEYIRYESKGVSGNQMTLTGLTRGYGGSTAGAHSNNDAVYPTGGWRNNYHAQQSSWYRENGAFPEKALIVGTGTEGQVQGGLTIVNLENNSTWGKYDAGANNTIKKAVKTVSAVGGKVLAGCGTGGSGMTELDFGNDMFSTHGSGNDSSTKLLLHGDGNNNSAYIMDSSPSPKTVTAGGVAVYTSQSKFGGSSLYFAGSNYSTLADSDDWYYGTGDFTIDTWVNFSAVNNLRMIYDQGTGVSYYLQLYYSGTSQAFVLDANTGSGTANLVAPFVASANTWYHLAAVRSSGTAYIFVDGKLIKSGTFDKNLDNIATSLYIGYNPIAAGDYFYGYMDDYKISKGVARWTTNFAPAAPYGSLEKTSDIESYFDGTNYNVWASKSKDGTAGSVSGITYLKDSTGSGILNSAYKLDGEYENDYYAKLLLHADGTGATFADSSDPAKTVTANGNATQSATQSEFGGKSAYFDGTGDYLALSDSEDFNFGDGDFTIDGWIYPSGSGSVLLYNGSNVNKFAALYLDSSTSGRVIIDNANAVTGVVLTANVWQHVAVVRSGASLKVYVNGTQSGTTGSVSGTLIGASTANTIGGNPTYALYFTGYMDEVRISKGTARWAGAFTAPTRVYENFAAKKIKYDSTNNILYADQSSGTANFDIWSKISSPKISADSTIDSADGTDRLSSQTITNDLAQDSTSIYFATDDGVKKVAKSTFSSGVTATFGFSTFSELPTGNDSYAKLLLHADGLNNQNYDHDYSASKNTLTFVGDAKISTTQSKFGGSSYYFDGTGDYISAPDSDDWNFGTSNFTIDMWVRFGDLTNAQIIAGQYVDANNQWYLQKDTNANGNKLKMYFISASVAKGNYVMTSAWSGVAINTWYHLSFVRSSTSGLIFIDGASQSLTETTAFSTNDVGDLASTLQIGGLNLASYVNGYIDEIRISKGTARWTTGFTPSTEAYHFPAMAVDYSTGASRLASAFRGLVVTSTAAGASPVYYDSTTETSVNRNNELSSSLFSSVSWVDNVASGYTGIAVGGDGGITIANWASSTGEGGTAIPKAPGVGFDYGFLIF